MAQDNLILNQAERQAKTIAPVTAIPDTDPIVAQPSDRLSAVQDALSISSTRIASSMKELQESAAKTKSVTSVIESAIGDVTAAKMLESRTALNADLQAQNATIKAVGVSSNADVQAGLMSTLRQEGQRVADLLDKKQEIVGSGGSFFRAVVNEFKTAGLDQSIANARAQQVQTATQIANATGAAEDFARVNMLTKQTLTEGVIEANYKAIAAEGTIKAAEVQLENMHSNATAMNNLVTADTRNISNLLQAFRLEGEAETRELNRKRQAFQEEQMEFNRKKWELELPAAETALKRAKLSLEDAELVTPARRVAQEASFRATTKQHNDIVALGIQQTDAVQRGQSLSGVAVEDRQTIEFGLRQRGDEGDKYIRLRNIGASLDPVLGSTAAEASESLSLIAPEGNFTPTKGTELLMLIRKEQADKYAASARGIPKDEGVIADDINRTAATVMKDFASDIRLGNPYHAPPMNSLASVLRTKDIPLFTRVLESMNMQEVDPQRILDAAIAGIRSKTITHTQASTGIEEIFEAAAAFNNTQDGGFKRVGLPTQTTYNVSIKVPVSEVPVFRKGVQVSAFLDSGLMTVDFMNGSQVQEVIVKALNVAPPKTTPSPAILDANTPAPKSVTEN